MASKKGNPGPAGPSRRAKAGTAAATRRRSAAVDEAGHEAPAGSSAAVDTGARALIRAGLKALGDVRGDMVARQAKVFELLLGIGQSPMWRPKAPPPVELPDPFDKFEAVFDQRVARSLQRLGMPTREQLEALGEQLEALTKQVQALQRSPTRPPAKTRRR